MNPKFLFVIFLACLVAGGLSYRILSSAKPEKDIKASYLAGGDFTLNGGERDRSLSEFKGRLVVLYFGYTHCPDVCPLGLTVIRDALKASEDFDAQVVPLFVTLDPARDTPARLSEYLTFFHPNLIGLTGTVEALKDVTTRYGTYFMNGKPDQQGNYAVDHTAYFYVIDREGDLVRVLDHNTSSQVLASELAKLL